MQTYNVLFAIFQFDVVCPAVSQQNWDSWSCNFYRLNSVADTQLTLQRNLLLLVEVKDCAVAYTVDEITCKSLVSSLVYVSREFGKVFV